MKFKQKDDILNAIFSLNVAGYTDFKDRKAELIANVIAGAPTLRNLVPQTGAKAKTTVELNILSTQVNWKAGDCVTEFSGTTTIAPRSAAIARITDREDLCLDKLDAKLPMLQKAGAVNTELPFAELYMNLKIAENGKALEKAIWQGSTTGGTGNNAMFDGYLQIASTETSSLAYYATFTAFTAGGCEAFIDNALANRSAEMYEMEDLTMYMSLPYFNILSNALISAHGIGGTGKFTDNGHQNAIGPNEFMYKGTNVKVKGTHGLNGDNGIFITSESNLRYLTDLEGDRESVDLFYDKYHKALVSDLVFAFAVQYEDPAQVIYLNYTGA
jgi:hypothetical protein